MPLEFTLKPKDALVVSAYFDSSTYFFYKTNRDALLAWKKAGEIGSLDKTFLIEEEMKLRMPKAVKDAFDSLKQGKGEYTYPSKKDDSKPEKEVSVDGLVYTVKIERGCAQSFWDSTTVTCKDFKKEITIRAEPPAEWKCTVLEHFFENEMQCSVP